MKMSTAMTVIRSTINQLWQDQKRDFLGGGLRVPLTIIQNFSILVILFQYFFLTSWNLLPFYSCNNCPFLANTLYFQFVITENYVKTFLFIGCSFLVVWLNYVSGMFSKLQSKYKNTDWNNHKSAYICLLLCSATFHNMQLHMAGWHVEIIWIKWIKIDKNG